jgi:uncharacterized Zn finger protein (UPF0148 family)
MKDILRKMNLWEHCPGCGALLVEAVGDSICANCGFYASEVEELLYDKSKKSIRQKTSSSTSV